MATRAELELRVARLEVVVRELARRADVQMERGVEAAAPRSEAPAVRDDDASWLSLAGVAVLAFAGAYVLRALTESGVLPRAGGIAAGVAYAAFWIWMADRRAMRGLRRNAVVHAATAAGIAFPLVWETTTQFHFLTPAAGAAVAALIGLVLLFVAHRNEQESIAWLGSVGAIAAALSIASAATILPPLLAASVVGAATLHVAIPKGWTFVAWPAAVLTNALAIMAIGFPLLHDGGYAAPRLVIAVLVSFSVLWMATMVGRRAVAGEDPQLFDFCESAILALVGFGGAAFVAAMTRTGTAALGTACLAVAVFGHVTAVTRRGAVTALFRVWIGAFSSYMTAVALVLLLPNVSAAAVAWAIFGAIALEIGARRTSLSLTLEGIAAISLAALLGGVARPAIETLFASSAADMSAPAAGIVIVAVAAIAFVRLGRVAAAGVRSTLLIIVAAGVFFSFATLAAHGFAVQDRAVLALVKTIVLAAIAAGLALLTPVAGGSGSIALARVILVISAAKLVVEDVRLGRASLLVAAFAACGIAMLIVARCARRHTSQPHAIHVTESSDTFLDAAGEKNVC